MSKKYIVYNINYSVVKLINLLIIKKIKTGFNENVICHVFFKFNC